MELVGVISEEELMELVMVSVDSVMEERLPWLVDSTMTSGLGPDVVLRFLPGIGGTTCEVSTGSDVFLGPNTSDDGCCDCCGGCCRDWDLLRDPVLGLGMGLGPGGELEEELVFGLGRLQGVRVAEKNFKRKIKNLITDNR